MAATPSLSSSSPCSCSCCSTCTKNPYLLYLFSFIAVSLSSGLVYGFPHLRNTLYSDGSTLTTGHRVHSRSGIARDKFLGTRYTVVGCITCAALGIIGLAFCSPSSIPALSISFFFVGLGSGGQLCLQPVASLFEESWQGTILASLSGAFQVSGLVFLVLVQVAKTGGGDGNGNGTRTMGYFSFAIILFGLALCALFLLPRHQFIKTNVGGRQEELNNKSSDSNNIDNTNDGIIQTKLGHCNVVSAGPNEDKDPTIGNGDDHEISPTDSKRAAITSSLIIEENENNADSEKGNEGVEDNNDSSENIPIFQLLKSTEYVLLVSWFSILLIPLQYYIGTIGFQLERKGDSDGTYINWFSIFYALSAILSPALGKIGDTFGLGCSQFIATALTAVSLLTLSSSQMSLNSHLIGMACYGIGRMTVFGMFFTNVGKRFGYTHYGSLAGLGLLVSAIFSLLQYPLIDIAARGSEYEVNLICGCATLILRVPYCVWLGLRERSEKKVSA